MENPLTDGVLYHQLPTTRQEQQPRNPASNSTMASATDLRRDPAAGTRPSERRQLSGSGRRERTSAELPRTSRSTTLSRSLTPLQCLTGAASCLFSSPAGGDDAETDMVSFRRTVQHRTPPHAESERSSGSWRAWRQRERKWREAGTDGVEVDLGNFRTAPLCVRVPFSDRDLLLAGVPLASVFVHFWCFARYANHTTPYLLRACSE